jgi:hypothetical protein
MQSTACGRERHAINSMWEREACNQQYVGERDMHQQHVGERGMHQQYVGERDKHQEQVNIAA